MSNKIPIVKCALPNPLGISKLKLIWSILFWPIFLGFKKFDKIISIELSRITPIYKKIFLKKTGKFIWYPIGKPDDIYNKIILYKKYIKNLDAIVVESDIHKQKLELIFPAEMIFVIYSYCFNNFKYEALEKKYDFNSIINIGYLGRYDKAKGILNLLRIFKEIVNEDDRIYLSYYGNDGDAKDKLARLVKEYNLEKKVNINKGWNDVDEYEKILSKVDFIVLPSESEGLPLVLLESMAYGNPFVSTNVGATSVLAKNNPDVLIVDNNYEAIKKGILEMLKKMRENGIVRERLRQFYLSNFNSNNIIKQWHELLESE